MLEKRCINAKGTAPAVGPYSHSCAAGNLLFVSGQIALAPDGSGMVRGTAAEEVKVVLSNLRAVLEEAGSGIEHVVKVVMFLADMNDFASVNEVYKTVFTENFPARSSIQVARLPLDAKVEIEAIAIIP